VQPLGQKGAQGGTRCLFDLRPTRPGVAVFRTLLSGKLGTVMENHQMLRRESRLGVCSPVVVRKLDLVCTAAQYFDDGADLTPDQPPVWAIDCYSNHIKQPNGRVHARFPLLIRNYKT
jgi:hypothetical protein